MSNPNTSLDRLREALQKDFNDLYTERFTTDWEAQRVVRSAELEVMSLPHLLEWVEKEVTTARIDELNQLRIGATPSIQVNVIGERVAELQRRRLKGLGKESKTDE